MTCTLRSLYQGKGDICTQAQYYVPFPRQYFEFVEEAEWVVEVMKATGEPTAITMCIGPPGDANNVPPGECAVRLARKGNVDCLELHGSYTFSYTVNAICSYWVS